MNTNKKFKFEREKTTWGQFFESFSACIFYWHEKAKKLFFLYEMLLFWQQILSVAKLTFFAHFGISVAHVGIFNENVLMLWYPIKGTS